MAIQALGIYIAKCSRSVFWNNIQVCS